MSIQNEFIRDLNVRLAHIPAEQRKRIQDKVIADLEPTGIFDPIVSPDDPIYSDFDEAWDKEQRILQQQLLHNIEPDEKETISPEWDQIVKHRHGKTDLHRAVEMGNIEEAHRLIRLGCNPMVEDNNGHNCVVIASLEENMAMLGMFREEGVIELPEAAADQNQAVG